MKCELCHQKNAETVFRRPGKNGREEELYVCKDCAEKEAVFGEEHGIQVAAMGVDLPPMSPPPDLPTPSELDALFGTAPSGEDDPTSAPPPDFPPQELLGKLGEVFGQLSEKLSELDGMQGSERCPKCGMTVDQLRTEGMLGCPNCLKAFRKTVNHLLDEMQGCREYRGTPAERFEKLARMKALKKALKEAIEREEYSEAKTIKAQLADLERQEGSDGV